jgi:hypothetical protein
VLLLSEAFPKLQFWESNLDFISLWISNDGQWGETDADKTSSNTITFQKGNTDVAWSVF